MPQYVLGIETSCDDTSAAIIRDDGFVMASAISSQDDVHRPFGGIVPEIASRNHTHFLLNLVESAFQKSKLNWSDISGIGVTNRPGLLGSLLVGVVTAKSLALAYKIPFIGIHHLEGHIMAPFLRDDIYQPPHFWETPFLALVVSGGHTSIFKVEKFGSYKLLGETIDDAAGEAFDKFAKMLNLGYPGGAVIDRLSKEGDARAYAFPRGLIKEDSLNFSFSGLKTAALLQLNKMNDEEKNKNLKNLCSSFQEAIVDALVTKVEKALRQENINKVIVTGGVSANSRLRQRMEEMVKKHSIECLIPPLRYCTDNAAMIGYAGLKHLDRKERSDLQMGVFARSDLQNA